jgi:hypothetical protein
MIGDTLLHRRARLAAAGLLLAGLVGTGSCGDSVGTDGTTGTDRTTGARITTRTTGLDIDPDGYRLVVDGTERGIISANDRVRMPLAPGSRAIALTDLMPNCTIDGPVSRTVTIVDTEVAPVEFAVVCTATSGVIGVVVVASGTDVEGTYTAVVGGVSYSFAGPSGPDYLTAVPPGDHVVSLVPPANCSVETDPQPVTVTAGGLIRDTVSVTFSVTCRRAFGTLQVTASTSGSIPAHGFEVWVCPSQLEYYCDYGDLEQFLGVVEPNGTLSVQVSPSTYNVELRRVPANCQVNALDPSRHINVPNGGTISVRFLVIC